jgi:Zn-dependent peptidase ImmA (M78 family)
MPSVIADLRALTPHRGLSLIEGLRVAELQAARLLLARGVAEPAVPAAVVSDLPRISVVHTNRIPISGHVEWGKSVWVITLNRTEPLTRRRFSLAHEFKHVLDAPFGDALYPAWRGMSAGDRAEHVADHFAASLLMPKAWVRRLYYDRGITELPRLAARFGVSQTAMRIRLASLGMLEPTVRCGRAAA